jgi:hypothetical protein
MTFDSMASILESNASNWRRGSFLSKKNNAHVEKCSIEPWSFWTKR